MILKLRRIKDLGIFRDYRWDADLPDFCRYNLIYGWNGCGKTTLSRMFASLSEGKAERYPLLEYEIEADGATFKNGAGYGGHIRVFNKDYVQANVERLGGPIPIFILGDENKKLAEEIAKDEKEVVDRVEDLRKAKEDVASSETRRGSIFTDIARTISQNVSRESTRNYRKPNAEADFSGVKTKIVLSDDEVKVAKGTLSQQQKPTIESLPAFGQDQLDLETIVQSATSLLALEVTSIAIKDLEDNSDISHWVEDGLAIHQSHKSTNCEFCNQVLPRDRIQELADHFNDADKELKKRVDKEVEDLGQISAALRDLPVREASNLYDEIQDDYSKCLQGLTSAKDNLAVDIGRLGQRLVEKKSKTTEKMTLGVTVDSTSFVSALNDVNEVIGKHNLKSGNFEKEKDVARTKLRDHYFSEIFDDVKKLDVEIKSKKAKIVAIEQGDAEVPGTISIRALNERIALNRSKISSSHKACSQINESLEKFLGRSELVFEVVDDGYVIKRYGEVAEDLSEGEKTAIAFVYFTVQLLDQDFNLEEGIVVIDDPISSLDSNSLFQAFGFLKTSVVGAKQVFILTHNFEFMRQVKNWFFHIRKVGGKLQRSFYMINNREVAGKRTAYLGSLDKLLMEYESEYHYLFSLLQNFKDDGTLESVYNFPNIGRKFLETFLAFKVPSHENLHEKMSHIDYDEAAKTAILRFVDTHSHAERSDGVLNFDMTLSNGGQNIIGDLLSMIKEVDVVHYETLVEAAIRA